MKMPELLVFARLLVIGFVGAEFFRVAFYLGANFVQKTPMLPEIVRFGLVLDGLLICLCYCVEREAHVVARRVGHSRRWDLLVMVAAGVCINELAAPYLSRVHAVVVSLNPYWAPAVLAVFVTVLLSPLLRRLRYQEASTPSELLNFLPDEAIRDKSDDLLANGEHAQAFAQSVLDSGAHAGLIYGIDGPWGIGKSSFVNLAAAHWEKSTDRVIVFRFEPLRYTSEPDLTDRLIRDLSAAIQQKVYAPEFRPAATRYARLLKGKADFSFLGFKLSLEPSQETFEELLEDVNDALKRVGHRVIIVVDDLDRLDLKTANSLLAATRSTFSLSQATYVLCYDTEVLAGGGDEGTRAREFLEKFVSVKISLFVDSASLRTFLTRDWEQADAQGAIPASAMLKLSGVLSELAEMLDSDQAEKYRGVLGDLRKIKRLVNAMLIVQIEKTDLGRTDFNKRDLIHLMILHLNYPGIFRRIYSEETGGRTGAFALHNKAGAAMFENGTELTTLLGELANSKQKTAQFLLEQLFDRDTLKFGDATRIDEAELRGRACFNFDQTRSLEGYLKLIVRFVAPIPQTTYVLYQQAVARVAAGEAVSTVLASPELSLEHGEEVHDRFWSVLLNKCSSFAPSVADDAINALVDLLPCYPSIGGPGYTLRETAVYSLVVLLDRAGWVDRAGSRRNSLSDYVVEIARRMFTIPGRRGLLERLADSSRGVLGWNDLMLFRLTCSSTRGGRLFNLYRALLLEQDSKSTTDGPVAALEQRGMRKLSQEVFALFKRSYIEPQRNFYTDVDSTREGVFFGDNLWGPRPSMAERSQPGENDDATALSIARARSGIKSFVMYQLSNSDGPSRDGICCGFYDESGDQDRADIASQMNRYVFGVCFNPDINPDNVLYFFDHCLMHLNMPIFFDRENEGYRAHKARLPGGLDPISMGQYWGLHGDRVRKHVEANQDRWVHTANYSAGYSEKLTRVYQVLDELRDEVGRPDSGQPRSVG
ncbi:KAP P-loop protein [Burkholderia glumae]|nr:KAP P-loop protein [Burkholderia glumae]QJW82288.1 AAA family ATPase [Burkholderia glumae]RQZ66018.1 KAP P-loop protein [Burkholderia glumae]UVS86009.1 KAP P-loop protein [Burkholderia glumae]